MRKTKYSGRPIFRGSKVMKIKTTTEIKKFDGQSIIFADTGQVATFRSVAVELLSTRQPGDEKDGGKDGFRAYQLASKIQKHDVANLSVEDLAFLRNRIGNSPHLNNVVIGRMFDIIDGNTDDEDENHVAMEPQKIASAAAAEG